MNLDRFESLLKRTIGLDAASIGHSAVSRAVRARMTETGCADPEEYAARVDASADELQALVETVVVPETWFFRDPEAFPLLTQRIGTVGHAAKRVVRVLSAPCATGEEPYSIAMAWLEAGLPAELLEIDAVDVSEHALARARTARYGRNSFRGDALAFRERHFTAAGGGWVLSPAVRRPVRLQRANLLDPSFLSERAPYDVVFCRNLLIYFDRATQDRAVAVLGQLLQPDGLLFVGPSETALVLSHGFAPVPAPMAFAFTKQTSRPPAVGSVAPERVPVSLPKPRPARLTRRAPAPAPLSSVAASRSAAKVPAVDPLREIALLADAGHFVEAARRCEEHIRAHGRSSEAFYLLGMVRDATGQHDAAAGFYRKALYLDPQHHAALVSLAYLREAAGDATEARVLRARAQRIAARRKEADA